MNTIRKEVFEIFEEYKKADTRDERLDVLKKYSENVSFVVVVNVTKYGLICITRIKNMHFRV